MEKTKTLKLTKVQAKDLADFIAWDIFYQIRADEEIDSFEWLCGMCDVWRALNKMVDEFNREGVE